MQSILVLISPRTSEQPPRATSEQDRPSESGLYVRRVSEEGGAGGFLVGKFKLCTMEGRSPNLGSLRSIGRVPDMVLLPFVMVLRWARTLEGPVE